MRLLISSSAGGARDCLCVFSSRKRGEVSRQSSWVRGEKSRARDARWRVVTAGIGARRSRRGRTSHGGWFSLTILSTTSPGRHLSRIKGSVARTHARTYVLRTQSMRYNVTVREKKRKRKIARAATAKRDRELSGRSRRSARCTPRMNYSHPVQKVSTGPAAITRRVLKYSPVAGDFTAIINKFARTWLAEPTAGEGFSEKGASAQG